MGFCRGGARTVYGKTARWIEDDGRWAPGEIVFAVELGLTAAGGVGSGPEIDVVFLLGIPVASYGHGEDLL